MISSYKNQTYLTLEDAEYYLHCEFTNTLPIYKKNKIKCKYCCCYFLHYNLKKHHNSQKHKNYMTYINFDRLSDMYVIIK